MIHSITELINWDQTTDAQLVNDIRFDSTNYTYPSLPITISQSCTFDGNKHTITVDNSITTWSGLFVPASASITITINIKNVEVTINGTNTVQIADNAGGIVGDCSSSNNYTINIDTCSVTGNYTIGQNLSGNGSGGICGTNCINATITNCYTTGNLNDCNIINNGNGGITGPLFGGTVSNCFSTGQDGSSGNYPGNAFIVGSTNQNVTIVNCYSTGNIGKKSAGIVCVDSGSPTITVINCYSTGTINSYAGGICYDKVTNASINIYNCYSTGNMSDSTAGGIIAVDMNSPPSSNLIVLQYCYALSATSLGTESGPSSGFYKYTHESPDATKQIISQGASSTSYVSPDSSNSIGFESGGSWSTPIASGYLVNNITVNAITYSNIWLTNSDQIPPQNSETPYYLKVFTSSPWIAHTSNTDSSGFFVLICYLKGTKILTDLGYIPIEKLKIGDTVKTYGNIRRNIPTKIYSEPIDEKIVWIGKFKVFSSNKHDFPICFKKNSISFGVPCDDLYVSQNHLIKYGDNYIKAKKAIKKLNKNIFIYDALEEIEYYHIATNGHKIIKCENVLSESLGNIKNQKKFISL